MCFVSSQTVSSIPRMAVLFDATGCEPLQGVFEADPCLRIRLLALGVTLSPPRQLSRPGERVILQLQGFRPQ